MAKTRSVKLIRTEKMATSSICQHFHDLAGINAWILHKETTAKKISRRDFMFQIVDEFATESVKLEMESREASKELEEARFIHANGIRYSIVIIIRLPPSVILVRKNEETTFVRNYNFSYLIIYFTLQE